MVSKSPRVTEAEEMQKRQKKNNYPEPSTYKVNFKRVDPQLRGCFKWSSDRVGYLEEAMYRGQKSPAYKTPSYAAVEKKPRFAKMWKEAPPKEVKKTSLSPTSYEVDKSFKESQLSKPRFFIPKGERVT